MKKILSIIFILWAGFVSAQSVGQFRYDTTKFLKVGGYNEVKIQNNTMDSTGGIFTNIGAGWGKWIKPKQISPGVIVIGLDTFTISGGSSSTDTTRTLYSSDSTIILTYNTTRDSINIQVDTNRVATKIFVTNIFNSDTTAKTDPEAIQSITAITDTSFENVHGNGDRDTVVIRGSGGSTTLQQAFDNNPTASPTINARGNDFLIDSMGYNSFFTHKNISNSYTSGIGFNAGTPYMFNNTLVGNSSYFINGDGILFDAADTTGRSTSMGVNTNYFEYVTYRDNLTTFHVDSSKLYFSNSAGLPVSVGIGTTTPDSTLHLVGGLKLDLPSKGNGKVLTSDANGAATWQTMTSGAAAAGTLTGTTLASNVVSSSLTGVGTIVSGVWHGTSIDTLYSSGVSNINVGAGLLKVTQGKGVHLAVDTGRGNTQIVTGWDLSKVRDSLPTYGTYSPTFTNKVNIDSIRAENWKWTRIGNEVNISGYIYMDATIAATNTTFTCTLPINPTSNFSNIWDLKGLGQADDNAAGRGLIFKANVGTSLAAGSFSVNSTAFRSYYFTTTYSIQ